jgi:gliding motility-associated-like protein
MKYFTFRFVLLPLLPILFFSTQLSAADYFWVGGAGNWAELDHWATNSGGAIRHSQIPTADDNVIFDANSFSAPNQVVNVNVATAFCRNLSWTGVTNTPILRGPSASHLEIFGSLIFTPFMQFDFRGDVSFQGGTAGNTIATAGKKFFKNLNFDNATGEWTLQSPITVDSTITLKNGILKTNSQAVDANRLYANCETSGTLDLANSTVKLRGDCYRNQTELIYTFFLTPQHTKTVATGSHVIDCTSSAAYAWIGDASLSVANLNPLNINAIRFSHPSGNCVLQAYMLGIPNFNAVKFSGNAKLLTSNFNIGKLSLTHGKSYEFESAKTFQIDVLEALGTCISGILIKSNNVGQVAKFTGSSAAAADFITIQDITATGSFGATNAIKLGITSGWIVQERQPQKLFWVNGNGNWDDTNHWSTTSGGASGACVPSAKDDVVFDQLSFNASGQNAVINVQDAFCKTMTWVNIRPEVGISGLGENNLHVFGSFYLAPTMAWEFAGKVLFESEVAGQEIKTAGQEMLNDVIFNGDGGWILRGPLSTELGIYFLKGTWNTNSETVNCMYFRSETKLKRNWILGDSRINVATVAPIYTGMTFIADNLTVDPGHSELRMLKDFSVVYFYGEGSLRFYNLTFLNTYETLSNERDDVKLSFNKVQFTSTHSTTRGSVTMDTLMVAAGSDNVFSEGYKTAPNGESVATDTKITVKTVITPVGCEVAKTVFRKANLRTNVTFVANRPSVSLQSCIVKNLLAEGNMIANNGRKIGETTGWTINRGTGRQLYWVGNGGAWFDKSHWSLTSGGVGGECVPTDEDDVYFDTNSFTTTGQLVTLSKGPNGLAIDYVQACRNMDWSGVRFSPKFHFMNLYVFGNLKFVPEPQMTTEASNLTMLSDDAYTMQTEGHKIYSVDMAGKGIGNFRSQMVAQYFTVSAGGLNTNSHNLTVSYHIHFDNFGTDSVYIRLNNSLIRVTSMILLGQHNDNVHFDGDKISFNAGTSTFQIETEIGGINSFNPSNTTQKHRFHNVIFTKNSGIGRTITVKTDLFFNKLFFAGDGELWNVNEMDSLIFSAGKTYSISATNLQTVYKYFEMIGNNCQSIRLQSLTTGVKATVRMNSGVIASDFVQMSDQKTDGTVQFFAGSHSTNIATTNQGWRFESPFNLKDVGFLGRDTVFCNATFIELKALTSNIATYKWSTNATTPTISVTTPGEYRAEVTFANNCVIRDTVIIEQVNLAPFDLGPDKTFCKNEPVVLQMPTVAGATYSWQDGTRTPQYNVTQTGFYRGEINLKGCKTSDYINIKVIGVAAVNLGRDTTLCVGQALNLNPNVVGTTDYLWQDGTRTPQYNVTQAGLYWLEVGTDNCKSRDSIRVAFINVESFDLGPDKTLCDGETITLNANLPNTQFTWQDGSTNENFTVSRSGTYSVVASIGNCSAKDSIKINFKPLPIVDLGADTALCEGTALLLSANILTGATYRWDNNATGISRTVNARGQYKIFATLDGCTSSDSIKIDVKPLPRLNLGNDTTICGSIVYDLQSHSNAQIFKWQDGSTQTNYTVAQSGSFHVEATLNGCKKTDSVDVNVKPLPTIELGKDSILCEGNTLTLPAVLQSGATYQWENIATSPYAVINSSGKYKVMVTLDGCTKSDSVTIGFNPLPNLKLNNDTTICESTIYLLKPSSNARSFKWQDGSTQASYKVTKAGKYVVEAALNGCSKMDSVQIGVTDLPKFNLGRDTTLCGAQSLVLKATVQNATLKWFNNSTANSVIVSKSGNYTAEATRLGCIFRDTIKATFSSPPQYSLGNDTTVCRYDTFALHINLPNTQISWLDNSRQNVLSITKDGTYWADVTSKEGCTFRDSIKVVVENCIPFKPFVPNVFSPNNDGVNDDVKPFFQNEFQITDNYLFQIYNRWGDLVYSTTDKTAAWDGTYKNQAIDDGVFVYVLRLTYRDFKGIENKALLKGDITLLH